MSVTAHTDEHRLRPSKGGGAEDPLAVRIVGAVVGGHAPEEDVALGDGSGLSGRQLGCALDEARPLRGEPAAACDRTSMAPQWHLNGTSMATQWQMDLQWQSAAVSRSQSRPAAVSRNLRARADSPVPQSMAINGNQWQSMAICELEQTHL